jgi:hypothetical protein
MSCEECNKAAEQAAMSYPFRAGDSEIGYGTVLIIACPDHARWIMDKLRDDIHSQ